MKITLDVQIQMIHEIVFSKRKRGVSILWSYSWTNSDNKLKDCNERVIAIMISASHDMFFINAYMPT